MNLGDIAVSRKTVQKLMNINRDVDAKFLEAFSDSNINLWDQNIVNGNYIIAYELNPGLDRLIQNMLPKVSFISESKFITY